MASSGSDQSFARIEVTAPGADELDELVLRLRQHGAEVMERKSVQLAAAPADGVYPQGFYVTTNQQTFVQLEDGEVEVQPALMDSAIVVDRAAKRAQRDQILRREERHGDRRRPPGHPRRAAATLDRARRRFSSSCRATSRSRNRRARSSARWRGSSSASREENGKILVVGGPAIVHTGAAEHFEKLIEWGYIHLLFAGNALAAHDIENALFGTSLGVNLEHGALAHQGTQNHMRAINAIRGAGGIRQAVASGLLKRGIMYTCVKNKVDFVLAGSIRDDGPLPDVITDAVEAQKAMRAKLEGVTIAMMMGTMLHSIAVGNLLPATVKTLCVDINPGGGHKADRSRKLSRRSVWSPTSSLSCAS